MDFQSLSRRELQALCKSKGIRANMSNAAMAEALLQCLPSVDRTDEIGSTAPPPMSAMKEATVIEEQTHGSLLPRGGRTRAKPRMVAAGNTEEDVPVPDQATLQGCQKTATRKAAVAPEAAEAIGEEQEHGCPLPRGGRARGKSRKAGARKEEEEVAAVPHTLPGNKRTVAEEAAAAPVDAEEVGIGRRTRRSARSKVKIAMDQKEEDVQAAAARKEQKADSSDAALASAVVSDKSCGDYEEHSVVIVVEEKVTKPQEGQDVTMRAMPQKTREDLQQDQRTVEDVATVKKMTRRSTRSKVAAAARKGQKGDSSDTAIGPEIDPKDDEVDPKVKETAKPQEGKNETRRATVHKEHKEVQIGPVTAAPEAMAAVEAEEVATTKKRRRPGRSKVRVAAQKGQKADSSDTTIGPEVDPKDDEVDPKVEETVKPQEGKNETRRATVHKEQKEMQIGQVTAGPEAMAAVEAEEVATAKRRRRPGRSKVRVAAQKGQKADSSDTTIGPEVDPKDDEVVPKVEETTKPQEGKNETRRATVYKAQEVQPGKVTVAPETMAAVEAEEVATAKTRRRSARSKVRVAARKGQKADSSDAVNGPTVSDYPKEEQVVEVVEEGPTKPNEEEREQISNARQFASLPKLEDSPILGVVSKPNAADASHKAAVEDEKAIKENDFTFTGEADLSNLLVNTLDRFAKPMYVSTDKEEKKSSECWWALL